MRGSLAVCLTVVGAALAAGCAADRPEPRPAPPSQPPTGSGGGLAMATPRASHTATVLPGGRVLIVGGCVVDHCDVAGGQSARGTLIDTAAVYDPATDSWRAVGRLDTPKYKLALAALPDGGPLVVGGQTADERSARLARTERFDPRTGRFGPGPKMSEPRYKISDAVVTLPDGRVVIAGGLTVDTYAGGTLRPLGPVPGPERQFPAVAALLDGRVLITGGYDDQTYLTGTAALVSP